MQKSNAGIILRFSFCCCAILYGTK